MDYADTEFWSDSAGWSVVEDYYPLDWGIQNVTDEQVEQMIVEDLLMLYARECSAGMPWWELFRFIQTDKQTNRVLDATCRVLDKGLLVEEGSRLKLVDTYDHMQAAMDFASVWFGGHEPPEGVETLQLTEKGQDMIDQLGVDGASAMLAAGFVNRHITSDTKH